jgi:hypothetical protein
MSRFSKWGAREEHMQHLEESTIHAWLDEALSSEESARVEAHVQECSECAAMVADARGLIAGASRIVSALDIVPGGVLPKTTPVAPAPGKSLWHSLHLTPFRAALAASLMIAVASVFAVRGSRNASVSAMSEQKVVAPMAAPPVATTLPPPMPSAVSPAIALTDANSGVSRKREQPARAESRQVVLDSTPVMQRNEAATEKALAAPKASAPPRAIAAADTTARVDSNARVVADARASAAMPTPPPIVMRRFDSAAARPLSEVVTTGTGGGRGGRGGQQTRAMAPAAQRAPSAANAFASGYDVVGCYQVSDSTSWPRTLPTQFLLARDSMAGTRYVRLVRDARGDTSVVGSWQPTGPGMALVSFNSTTPASRFLLTQGPAGALLTQVPQDAARLESAARTRAALMVRMSCR